MPPPQSSQYQNMNGHLHDPYMPNGMGSSSRPNLPPPPPPPPLVVAGETAVNEVIRGMGDLQYNAGATMTDLIFLRSLMENPVMKKLMRTHDILDTDLPPVHSDQHQGAPGNSNGPLDTARPQPVYSDLLYLCQSTAQDLEPMMGFYRDAEVVGKILRNPIFLGLADAHDMVSRRSFEPQLPDAFDNLSLDGATMRSGMGNGTLSHAVRIVGIRRIAGEPLGVTLRVDDEGSLKVTRILSGGIVDKQGLLQIGDIVLEINGLPVENEHIRTADNERKKVVDYLKNFTGDDIQFRIMPLYAQDATDKPYQTQMYMRALFSYNPEKDDLLPNAELGLQFESGDILEITESQKDPNWWQARNYTSPNSRARLIPSELLEERRAAYARPDLIDTRKLKYGGLTSKKRKKKELYSASNNSEFDRLDLSFYEEVARMPPFPRKTLVLIGATAVGRRTIKNALIQTYPQNFSTPVPTTSREPKPGEEPGKSYHFVSKQEAADDVKHSRFLEYGEFYDNIYGTRVSSIHEIIDQGKMCVLDCSPQALKILRTAEFMPFVVLIAAPPFERLREMRENEMRETSSKSGSTTTLSRLPDRDLRKTVEESQQLEQEFRQYIDLKIINDDPEVTFRTVCDAVCRLSSEMQWVPVSWVY